VLEETGVRVRLGAPLNSQRYPVRGGMKTVLYWTGRPTGDHDVSSYEPNAEVDDVRWVPEDQARGLLTYAHDVATLDEALVLRKRTRTLVVLRHATARSRRSWPKDDRRRPLLASGRRQAERLVPVLAAYGVARVVTSGSTRCVDTVAPYAAATASEVEVDDVLSEEDATPKGVRRAVHAALEQLDASPKNAGGTLLCTHRPVLPHVFAALGVADPRLEKGELLVVHLRGGQVVACERHQGG
jgi:8-oxo-(d)GTP phosphatase